MKGMLVKNYVSKLTQLQERIYCGREIKREERAEAGSSSDPTCGLFHKGAGFRLGPGGAAPQLAVEHKASFRESQRVLSQPALLGEEGFTLPRICRTFGESWSSSPRFFLTDVAPRVIQTGHSSVDGELGHFVSVRLQNCWGDSVLWPQGPCGSPGCL